jgi:pyruvate/2-oxoglutarate dehydrogenase complex dihydrolipoamide dehydrogenase (E3) component
VKVSKSNTIEVNPDSSMTTRPGVFAGGDAVLGPASVIEAIQAGRCAASSIDKYLGGSGDITEKLAAKRTYKARVPASAVGPDFQDRNQAVMKCLEVDERCADFKEVELGYDENTALSEAQRCLQCAFRNQICPVPLPPVTAKEKEGN